MTTTLDTSSGWPIRWTGIAAVMASPGSDSLKASMSVVLCQVLYFVSHFLSVFSLGLARTLTWARASFPWQQSWLVEPGSSCQFDTQAVVVQYRLTTLTVMDSAASLVARFSPIDLARQSAHHPRPTELSTHDRAPFVAA